MKKLLAIFFTLLCINLHTAWLDNIPGVLVQPDGKRVNVYFSGDEFHNWPHDYEGFTIIQDALTGYWCWAREENGDLISTGYPIHLYNPTDIAVTPRQNISNERYLEKRRPFEQEFNSRTRDARSPSTGVIQSLTVFIRFADDPEFTKEISYHDEMLNAQEEGVNSLYRYFYDASYGQLEVFSPMFPKTNGNTVVSYRSTQNRSYFQPYNSVTNPNGYQGGNYGNERIIREHTLLRDALLYIRPQIPPSLILDSNGSGRIDNVNFIIRGEQDGWSDLLWPHRYILYTHHVEINGSIVSNYNFNIEDFPRAG